MVVELSRYAARGQAVGFNLEVYGVHGIAQVGGPQPIQMRLGLRSTINLKTSQAHAYKKSSPHAILKTFADDLKLMAICPRTEEAYYGMIHSDFTANQQLHRAPRCRLFSFDRGHWRGVDDLRC